jgi:hypothetical protein
MPGSIVRDERRHGRPAVAAASLWYGWSEMQRDVTEIKEKAAELRAGVILDLPPGRSARRMRGV